MSLENLDIEFVYHFIYFNPFEEEKHLIEQLKFIYNLPYAIAIFIKLNPFPCTIIKEKIEKEKPEFLPVKTISWFAKIHSLALRGPILRRISKVIFRYNLFRNIPEFINILFIPAFIIEVFNAIKKIRHQ